MTDEVKTTQSAEEQVPAWAKKIVEQNEVNQEKLTRLESENKMLKDLAGKAKIADWKDRQKDTKIKTVHFKKVNGEIVIGWDKLDYSKFKKASTPREENVFTTLHPLKGEAFQYNYHDFTNVKEFVSAIIRHNDGTKSTVEFETGEVITVENKFLNA